jgi:hypothetical protein
MTEEINKVGHALRQNGTGEDKVGRLKIELYV